MERLILRSLEGTATAQEDEQLRAWRAASAENERLYQDFARLWNVLPEAYHMDKVGPVPDARELIGRAGIRRLPGRQWAAPLRLVRWVGLGSAAAAAVAILTLAASRILADGQSSGAFG